MKHIKTIIISVFATVFIAAFSFTAFADYVESPWIYTVKDDAVTITGYMGGESPCVVPWTLADLDIKKVEGGIFIGKKDDEGKDINIVYVPNNNVSVQNNDQVTIVYYNLGEPLPVIKDDENLSDSITDDGDLPYPVIDDGDLQDPVIESNEDLSDPVKDADIEKSGDEKSPVFSSGGSSAGGRMADENVEIAAAPPDVDFELEEIEEETVVVTPMEEAAAPVILDENGEEMDVFRVAGVQPEDESENEKTVTGPEADASQSIMDDAQEDKPASGDMAESTKKIITIIVICLAVIAAAGGVYIFIRRKR